MPTTPQVTPFITGAELSISKPGTRETGKGEPVSYQVEAFNATEYKATSLPAGLSINAGTGLITGTPTTVSVKTVTLEVKGGSPVTTASTTFEWTIFEPSVAEAQAWPGKKPPLALQVELVYPDGTTKRWDSDAIEAKDQPTGITFRTQRYTGFADAQLTLNRRIDLEYPDLGLLDGLNLIGHDGSVAYEGRIAQMPRNLQSTPQITVQAQGWMSHAKDQPFVEVFVDRDLSKWGSPSTPWRIAVIAENYSYGSSSQLLDQAGHPAVELSLADAWVSPYKPIAEAWWLPQPGITIAHIYYNFASKSSKVTGAGWAVRTLLSADDHGTGKITSANLLPGPSAGYLFSTITATAAALQIYDETTPSGEAGATYYAQFESLAVYGPHELGGRGPDPAGFFVSDMMGYIANKWAPKLDTSGIQLTTFPVPHASFLSDTLPYDAFQTLNTYHRWEMAVFEGKKLLYWPIDLTDYDWEVRLSDPGTTVQLQGDDAANLCNGVIVNYKDLSTGYQTRLSPDTYSELKDNSPDNPVNLNGLKLYTTLSLSVPTTKEGAIQIGRTYLAEFNQSKAPGSITISGHIRDRAGHFQQGWKVRASDRLIISDLPSDAVRVVGETEWSHDNKTLTISVDSQFKRLDAILARLGVAVEASNLSLP